MPGQEPSRFADDPHGDSSTRMKPLGDDEVERAVTRVLERVTLGQEVERLRAQLTADGRRRRPAQMNYEWPFMNSMRMHAVKDMIDRVAGTDATVLVWGESGVGKELVTRAIHDKSPRRERPFVKVNCAALPLELLESELFGYERGAFTGAHRQKPGKFELANTGTIFLDEIGEMPMPVQAKLLQVLQDREFSRLGSQSDIRVDVRVIAATNKDLARLVQQGHFREDLYYRLNVLNIHVPPLRERQEEIPVLVEYFLDVYSREYGRPRHEVAAETMQLFMDYAWRGNVRELENVIKRIVALGNETQVVQELTRRPMEAAEAPSGMAAVAVVPPVAVAAPHAAATAARRWDESLGLREIARRAAREAEETALKEVLDRVRWHRVEAARRLKVSYKTLLRKMQECGLAS
jgi:transcriptional regulator with PAS, ATPase and Fis domain